jgi:hypothetical protein
MTLALPTMTLSRIETGKGKNTKQLISKMNSIGTNNRFPTIDFLLGAASHAHLIVGVFVRQTGEVAPVGVLHGALEDAGVRVEDGEGVVVREHRHAMDLGDEADRPACPNKSSAFALGGNTSMWGPKHVGHQHVRTKTVTRT